MKQRNRTLAHILFSILVLYSFAFCHEQACNLQDQSSLLSFFANISISSPYPPLNWSNSISCCFWEGVECNIAGKVTHLQLPSRGLEGLLTSSINNLTELTHLNLSRNYFQGSLGEGIIRLTNLRILDLSSNNLFGSIPREIGNLLYLEKLHLDINMFSGLFPSSLMNCTNLVEIILKRNNLNGDITKLDFSRLILLQKLDLRANNFTGTLPKSIYSCKSLVVIGVSGNNISGKISSRIKGLKSLSYLSLSYNHFTNITTCLRVLGKCKNLKTLLLSSNFFGESLPNSINFTSVDDFPMLEYFDLGECNFGGPIPNWISKLKGLRYLGLDSNNMTGTIPDWLDTLPNLISLILFNNSFSGSIPLSLCQLPALVSPSVDPKLPYFHFDLPTFHSGANKSNRPSIAAIYGELDLSYNALHGNIPSEIGNLINLQVIYLNNNHLYGHIPTSISNLKNLEYVNLSTNSLTGGIPASFGGLNFLSKFDVSYNNLQGPIPNGVQFSTFPSSSFEGNPGLCGQPLIRPCSTVKRSGPEGVTKISHFSKKPFLDGLFVGFGVGFSVVLVVVTPFFWLKNYRHKGPC